MTGTGYKVMALFLVALFLVAAVHEMLPGLCLPRNMDGSNACPFCQLIYTILIVIACILMTKVEASFRAFRLPPVFLPITSPRRSTWSRRGPPAIFV